MISARRFFVLALVCALAATATAQQTRKIKVDFKDFKLKNGLRVLLVEDHTAPVISIAVTYDVGSRNERKGRTGFAHLFEHMMFTGSQNVGKNEYSLLIDTNGGGNNATTSEDRTWFYSTVPSNQLEMVLFLEADRMRSLDITQENLDGQRNAVQEERRRAVDNQAYGKSGEKMQETIYDNFAYKHTVFGSMDDLNAASLQDVREFFRIYYAPNNAALAVVGDFKTETALAKIKTYFEGIPSQPAPPAVDAAEPPQTAERRFKIEDPLARAAQIVIGYKGIIANTPDFYALQVLNQALAAGQSSRLFQKLIKEKEIASGVFSLTNAMRSSGDYEITASLPPGKRMEDLEAAINEEIERIQREPIADWELAKAKNAARRSSIQVLQRSLGIATRLTQYAIFYNDPGLINTQFDKYSAVTKDDVMRVANKYLKPTNRTVAITVPAKTSAPSAGN